MNGNHFCVSGSHFHKGFQGKWGPQVLIFLGLLDTGT